MDHARCIRESLELDVFEQNTTGRGFYEKYGFREISRYMHKPSNAAAVKIW